MRFLKKNKQKLYYATYSEEVPVYETDEDGKIKYTEVDGKLVPIQIGIMAGYNKPVIFCPYCAAQRRSKSQGVWFRYRFTSGDFIVSAK